MAHGLLKSIKIDFKELRGISLSLFEYRVGRPKSGTFLRMAAIPALIGLVSIATPAAASTILVAGSDSEAGVTASVNYLLKTTGSKSVNNGQTGFSTSTASLTTPGGVEYVNYLGSVPSGATLTGATLDYAGLFSGVTDGSSLTGGTFFFQPSFSSVLNGYTVKITSTLAHVSLSGSSAAGYDLWPIFQNDLLAGHAIDITWSAVDTFSADLSGYGNNCKSCDETLRVTSTASFTASSYVNTLGLNFTPAASTAPAAVPEPASLCLAGLALVGLGVIGRKKRA